jgi:diguanylate cyclase (GGDEF)-like protein/PAS domain S-box-containing protein
MLKISDEPAPPSRDVAAPEDIPVDAPGSRQLATREEPAPLHLMVERNDVQGDLDAHIQALPLALAVSEPTEELTIREWSQQGELVFGYSRAEIIGQSPYGLIIPLDQQQPLRDRLRELRSSGGTAQVTVHNVTKDGRRIWCEWICGAVRDRAGRIARVIAMVQDVTQRVIAQERMRLWTSLLEQSAEGIMVCDSRLRILVVNPAFEAITGYSGSEVMGKTPRLLQSGRQSRTFYRQMWQEITRNGQWRGEIWNRRKSGQVYSQWLTVHAVCDQPGDATHYVGTFSDTTQRKRAELRARYLAEHDALTDLPNGTLLFQRLREFAGVAGHTQEKIGVLSIDLDRFNNVNDSMGRTAGDSLLQIVARRLSSAVRRTDLVARLGADEFIVVLPDLHQATDAIIAAEQLLASVRMPMVVAGQEHVISASIGICIFPEDGTESEELIRNAATAMRRSKSERRDAFQFYRREMNESAAEALRTETALRLALERQELVLHFQPQIDLTSGAVTGAEALLRWNRPGAGLLLPAQFIPIAQESGLMPTLGRWVIRAALQQIEAWGDGAAAGLVIAVNISANELNEPGFFDYVAGELRGHKVEPDRLELELTESVSLYDADTTAGLLQRFHNLGVRLSLDDFGTGFSTLAYLGRYPIDRIKIDQSFIREMTINCDAIQIVRAIIALAGTFAMKVIAEGVETTHQLAVLRAERCDEIQGYLAGAAVAPEEFIELLRNWRAAPFQAGGHQIDVTS